VCVLLHLVCKLISHFIFTPIGLVDLFSCIQTTFCVTHIRYLTPRKAVTDNICPFSSKRENYNYRTPNNELRNYRTPNINFVKMTLETLVSCFSWHLVYFNLFLILIHVFLFSCDPFALLPFAWERFCCVVALKNEQRRRRGQKAHQKRKRPPWMDQTPAVMAAPTTLPCPQIRSEPKDFCSLFLLLFLPSIMGSKLTQGGRRRQAPIREWEGKATNKNEEGIAYGNQWNQPPGQVNNLTGNHRRI
jgi:hypothetical protein